MTIYVHGNEYWILFSRIESQLYVIELCVTKLSCCAIHNLFSRCFFSFLCSNDISINDWMAPMRSELLIDSFEIFCFFFFILYFDDWELRDNVNRWLNFYLVPYILSFVFSVLLLFFGKINWNVLLYWILCVVNNNLFIFRFWGIDYFSVFQPFISFHVMCSLPFISFVLFLFCSCFVSVLFMAHHS